MAVNTGDYGSTSELVANGGAFSISMLDPESGMRKHRSENTVILPFEDFDAALATGLIWRQDRTESHSDLRKLVKSAKSALSWCR
ncbi:hypothetical protein [Saccharopolyspora sp. NPDC002376]